MIRFAVRSRSTRSAGRLERRGHASDDVKPAPASLIDRLAKPRVAWMLSRVQSATCQHRGALNSRVPRRGGVRNDALHWTMLAGRINLVLCVLLEVGTGSCIQTCSRYCKQAGHVMMTVKVQVQPKQHCAHSRRANHVCKTSLFKS